MDSKLVPVIIELLRDLQDQYDTDQKIDLNPDTIIYGEQGFLDSTGLVNLILSLEEFIEEQYDIEISLADEKAFSISYNPFRTVKVLADYCQSRIQERL